MRRLFIAVGVVVAALALGAVGIFIGISLARIGEPRVVVRNLTPSPIPMVRLQTSVGETYVLRDIPPNGKGEVSVSGRDKQIWAVVTRAGGETDTTERRYVSSQGIVFIVVAEDHVVIDWEP